ncbi:MAG: M4 family metallopeptidase [Chitinophagaceae bacterium]
MKRIYQIVLLGLMSPTFLWAQSKPHAADIAQRTTDANGQVKFITFKPGASKKRAQSVQVLQQHLNLPSNHQFQKKDENTDELGITHEKFQEYYMQLPVEFGQYKVHSKGGIISSINGEMYDVSNVNTTPSINASNALVLAKQKINASNYLSGNTASDQAMGYYGAQAELVVFPKIQYISSSNRLAYRLDIYATDPLYRADVYVDAHTGEVFFENNKIHHQDVAASGNSLYEGNVNFTADYTGSLYRLRQTSSGGGCQTYNMNNGTSYTNSTDFTSSSSVFTNTKGVQAHYAAEQTHGYYMQKHNRNSFNGTGGIIKSYVSYSSNYVNAFWNGSVMTYGDGNGTTYGPLITLDIVGHEITHGVTEYSANLVYQKESGALNESFSDIFGEMVELHAKGSNDWLMGNEIFLTNNSGAIRSMSNPKLYSDPDCYGGSYWINPNCSPSSSNDYCGVHSNSGVQNKWYYLLSVGGSGTNDLSNPYTVAGIGTAKAAAIAYRNLTVYLNSNSNFADARAGAIQAAIDLYGAGSPEEIATTNAWYAVGVGNAYGGSNPPPPPLICVNGTMNLVIKLDNYPSETSWKIFDGNNTIVAQGQNYAGAGSVVVENFSLGSGNYDFVIYDSYGDGICCSYGQGYYHLVSGNDTVKSGGAFGSSETTAFCVTNTSDTLAPTAPSNLSVSNVSYFSLDLNWNASTDNVAVTSYTVYQGSSVIGTTSSTSYSVAGLAMNTAYSFYVVANDAAYNTSGASNVATATTLNDVTAPSAPTNLSASNTTQTSTDLSWNASSDNVGVVLYNVYQGASLIGTSTSTSFVASGLTANTTYSFSVKALDGNNNVSGSSNVLSVTTLNTPPPPPNIVLHQGFFESGWDGWSDGGSDCARYKGSRSAEGSYSIYIRDNSGIASAMTSPTLDLTAYNTVQVEFDFYASSMETNEDFWLLYNNGSNWTTVKTWKRGTDFNNNTFYHVTVSMPLSTYGSASNAQFRFQCDASANDDLVYIDKVIITGINQPISVMSSLMGEGVESLLSDNMDEIEGIEVYPNPAKNTLYVKGLEAQSAYKILDLSGRVINSGIVSDQAINISQLHNGLYMIMIETEDGDVENIKFIKE